MSEKKIFLYSEESKLSPSQERQFAVEAALGVIRSEALGGGERKLSIDYHMKQLNEYADSIRAALKKVAPEPGKR